MSMGMIPLNPRPHLHTRTPAQANLSCLIMSHTAFSNSRTRKEYIDAKAKEKGLTNLNVVTGDVSLYDFEKEKASFESCVVYRGFPQMFEHMKNYELLMARVAKVLKPGGKLFVYIFARKDSPYDYEEGWMTTHFFTGGTIPSADLLPHFPKHLKIEKQWWVNGNNYSKIREDWLSLMIANKKQIWPHLVETYGEQNASTWYNRWQILYMACSELFAYDGGYTWESRIICSRSRSRRHNVDVVPLRCFMYIDNETGGDIPNPITYRISRACARDCGPVPRDDHWPRTSITIASNTSSVPPCFFRFD
ncbi:(S)-coclaurine N-methyltransferase [Seiridium cupressi]